MSDDIIRPNTDKAREERERPRREDVVVRKRSGFREFLDGIMPRNSSGFLRHVLYGIIAPRTVDVVDDVLKDGIDRILHPDDPRDNYYDDYRYRRREDRDVPYRSYDNYYESRKNSADYNPYQNERRSVDPRDIVFTKRETANMVLNEMREQIREDRFCTIGDFYEIVRKITRGKINITPTYVEETYGWSNLEGVRPEITYDGRYSLRLPRTERI